MTVRVRIAALCTRARPGVPEAISDPPKKAPRPALPRFDIATRTRPGPGVARPTAALPAARHGGRPSHARADALAVTEKSIRNRDDIWHLIFFCIKCCSGDMINYHSSYPGAAWLFAACDAHEGCARGGTRGKMADKAVVPLERNDPPPFGGGSVFFGSRKTRLGIEPSF